MDIYYITSGSIRIAEDEDFINIAQNGNQITDGDGNPMAQLLAIADSTSNAQILFDELFVRKTIGLATTNQSFGGVEFEGLHQNVLDDVTIYPMSETE